MSTTTASVPKPASVPNPSTLELDHEALLAGLENTTLESFSHAEHVRAAWLYLHRYPPIQAIERFSQSIQRLAASKGAANHYHETITWAFVLLIRERIERTGTDLDWEAFATANPDLLTYHPSVLERYYRRETLESPLARKIFLLPDRPRAE